MRSARENPGGRIDVCSSSVLHIHSHSHVNICGCQDTPVLTPTAVVVTVDRVLESCLQLLSLFFMTIGRTTEAPAAYAMTSTIKRLLDHLTESGLYSGKDLDSMASTLGELDQVLTSTSAAHSPYLVELLANRQELCKTSLAALRKELECLEEPLPAVHEKLISILRSMSLANTKPKVRVSPTW